MPLLLERRAVSRKTPLDGRLEISAASAERLAALGGEVALASGADSGRARLQSMTCSCAKGAGSGHVHHFVESPLLARLGPETTVRVELDESRATPLLRIEAVAGE